MRLDDDALEEEMGALTHPHSPSPSPSPSHSHSHSHSHPHSRPHPQSPCPRPPPASHSPLTLTLTLTLTVKEMTRFVEEKFLEKSFLSVQSTVDDESDWMEKGRHRNEVRPFKTLCLGLKQVRSGGDMEGGFYHLEG